MIQSSDRSVLLIVTEEDGDQLYYLKFEQHFSWPGGRSGPTVGVGYDCGYETKTSIMNDWTIYIGQQRAMILTNAAGITGDTARQWVNAHRGLITITWDESLSQFKGHELPKWEAIVQKALPNTELLSGDSFGALVSLTYNRGASYDLPGDRFREMRSIKEHMLLKRFDLIPGEFLSMRRLWPNVEDLRNRRVHEAILFRDGLALPIMPPIVAATATAGSLAAT